MGTISAADKYTSEYFWKEDSVLGIGHNEGA